MPESELVAPAQRAPELEERNARLAARAKLLVLPAMTAPETKRAYSKSLDDFFGWCTVEGRSGLSKSTVAAYRAHLLQRLSPSTTNVRLAALRRLASEAADAGELPGAIATAIGSVKGARKLGVRAGNWLALAATEKLITAPDAGTLKGKRDRALLGTLIGCGLRREELAELACERIQQRDSRWALVDLVGKGNRTRTIPMPAWTKSLIDIWTAAAGISSGRVFRPVNKGGRLSGDSMTSQAVYVAVKTYAGDVAPHDLRRTFAKLAHKGHAALEQIQLSLGHSSIQTTERYLGVAQDLSDAPCDHLGIHISF